MAEYFEFHCYCKMSHHYWEGKVHVKQDSHFPETN